MDGSMRALPFAVIDVPEWAAGGPNAAAGCCLQPLVTRRRAMRGALCVSKNGKRNATPVISSEIPSGGGGVN